MQFLIEHSCQILSSTQKKRQRLAIRHQNLNTKRKTHTFTEPRNQNYVATIWVIIMGNVAWLRHHTFSCFMHHRAPLVDGASPLFKKQVSHLSKSGLASFCCSLALLILLCVFVRECVFLWILRDVSSVAHTVRTVDRSVRITELRWISLPPPCLTAINYRCMKMFRSQFETQTNP